MPVDTLRKARGEEPVVNESFAQVVAC